MLDVPRALRTPIPFSPSSVVDNDHKNSALIEEITLAERARKRNPSLELDPRLKEALEAVYQNDTDRIFVENEAADILLAISTLGRVLPRSQMMPIYEKTVRVHAWYGSEFLDCHQVIVEQVLKDLESAGQETIKTRMSFLFQTVFKQASLLLDKISKRLRFPVHVEGVLWCLLVEAIVSKSYRRFFREKDLLTMICCFIFAVSKLIGTDISFNSLMEACRKEEISNFESAFLNVFLDGHSIVGHSVNIVKFYNEHFLACFKEFILHGYVNPPKHNLLHITRTSGSVLTLSSNIQVVGSYRRSLSLEPKTRKRLCWTF